MADKKETTEKLRNYIKKYNKVFVLGEEIPAIEKFFRAISRQTAKQVLVLVNGLKTGNIQKSGVEIQTISYEEYCNIEDLYYMYEFSNHIYLLNDNVQYGTLSNYISNGLLTEEEIFTTLLLG